MKNDDISTEIIAKCVEIILQKITVEEAIDSFTFAVEEITKATNKPDKAEAIVGYVVSLMAFGYYLGSKDAVEGMINLVESFGESNATITNEDINSLFFGKN